MQDPDFAEVSFGQLTRSPFWRELWFDFIEPLCSICLRLPVALSVSTSTSWPNSNVSLAAQSTASELGGWRNGDSLQLMRPKTRIFQTGFQTNSSNTVLQWFLFFKWFCFLISVHFPNFPVLSYFGLHTHKV